MYVSMNDQDYEDMMEIIRQSQHPRREGLLMAFSGAKSADEDRIHLIWDVEDILVYAEDHDYPIPSRERALEILKAIDAGHDCSVGVSWETIREYL